MSHRYSAARTPAGWVVRVPGPPPQRRTVAGPYRTEAEARREARRLNALAEWAPHLRHLQ